MTENNWFLILYTFSVLGIAFFLVRTYANRYQILKNQIHLIHSCIETIDDAIQDDQVTKEEFINSIKRCLRLLEGLI